MSKKSLYLLGIVTTILIGTWIHVKICCSTCTVETVTEKNIESELVEIDNSKIDSKRNNGFNFSTSTTSFQTSKNFNFKQSESKILEPVSDSIVLGIKKLTPQLDNQTQFRITGYYSKDEINNSIFPNLGIARANSVKTYLITKEIPQKNIKLLSEQKENLIINNDTVYGPISYALIKNNTDTKTIDWEAQKKELQTNPIVLYFDTQENNIQLSEANKSKVEAFVNYLDNVPNSKLIITGHTDDRGREEVNVYYSESRANFAKSYFVSNGIPADKIKISGKGPNKPIASNETSEGRAKNRRVEITIEN